MNTTITQNIAPRWQDNLGRGLMWLAALGAFIAFISVVPAVKAASSDTVWLETWRLFGFLVFTGMFVLLALRPRKSAGVWELAFFHKAAMAIAALLLPGAEQAASAGMIDGVLAILIVLAYILTRGWTAWKNPR
jgi:hypothetical protein